jgi:lipoic acid synthetase
LEVLRSAKEFAKEDGRELITKTSIMLGVGEEEAEVVEALERESVVGASPHPLHSS